MHLSLLKYNSKAYTLPFLSQDTVTQFDQKDIETHPVALLPHATILDYINPPHTGVRPTGFEVLKLAHLWTPVHDADPFLRIGKCPSSRGQLRDCRVRGHKRQRYTPHLSRKRPFLANTQHGGGGALRLSASAVRLPGRRPVPRLRPRRPVARSWHTPKIQPTSPCCCQGASPGRCFQEKETLLWDATGHTSGSSDADAQHGPCDPSPRTRPPGTSPPALPRAQRTRATPQRSQRRGPAPSPARPARALLHRQQTPAALQVGGANPKPERGTRAGATADEPEPEPAAGNQTPPTRGEPSADSSVSSVKPGTPLPGRVSGERTAAAGEGPDPAAAQRQARPGPTAVQGAWKGRTRAAQCRAASEGRRRGHRLDGASPQHAVLRKRPATERQTVSVLLTGSEGGRRGGSGGRAGRGGGRGQSCSLTRCRDVETRSAAAPAESPTLRNPQGRTFQVPFFFPPK